LCSDAQPQPLSTNTHSGSSIFCRCRIALTSPASRLRTQRSAEAVRRGACISTSCIHPWLLFAAAAAAGGQDWRFCAVTNPAYSTGCIALCILHSSAREAWVSGCASTSCIRRLHVCTLHSQDSCGGPLCIWEVQCV
jgi:hypothetical protein